MVLDEKDIQALNEVRVHVPRFVEFLEKSRAQIYTDMEATIDTSELHALRGRAGVMTRLIKEINDSAAAADRLAAARGNR